MTTSMDQVYSSARLLSAPEMGTLVARLLGDLSEALPAASDEEINAVADAREEEMDRDPGVTISHDEMLEYIRSRRR